MDSLEALVQKQRTEKRALSGEDVNTFNSLKEQVNEIDKALQALKVNMDDFSGSGSTNASASGERAYTPKEQQEIRSFVNFVRTGVMENRDLSNIQNGAMVP